jgi:hypothetical protein
LKRWKNHKVSATFCSKKSVKFGRIRTPLNWGECPQRRLSRRRTLSPRARNQLAAAVRAGIPHLPGAVAAKRAFVRANKGFTVRCERLPAFLALGFHFQSHAVPFSVSFLYLATPGGCG